MDIAQGDTLISTPDGIHIEIHWRTNIETPSGQLNAVHVDTGWWMSYADDEFGEIMGVGRLGERRPTPGKDSIGIARYYIHPRASRRAGLPATLTCVEGLGTLPLEDARTVADELIDAERSRRAAAAASAATTKLIFDRLRAKARRLRNDYEAADARNEAAKAGDDRREQSFAHQARVQAWDARALHIERMAEAGMDHTEIAELTGWRVLTNESREIYPIKVAYGYAEIGIRIGAKPATIRKYAADGRLPIPDGQLGQSPGWYPATVEEWVRSRPGQGVGGGRPRKAGGSA